jgi:hypothetical protein
MACWILNTLRWCYQLPTKLSLFFSAAMANLRLFCVSPIRLRYLPAARFRHATHAAKVSEGITFYLK